MKNKVIWITGASSGIGEALAYACDNAGAKLILSSRNRDELYRVKSACKSPVNIHILSLDLEKTDSLADKAEEAIRIYGHIDMLINCGGISQRSLALETTLQTEQRLMNVNFWGTVVLSKAVLPNMIAQGGGKIVCISSLVGKFGTRFRSSYAASKHALHGYFDSLRSEVYDKNIQITLVCPGFIKTNVTLNALTAEGSAYGIMDHDPDDRMSADECAKQILQAIKANKEEVYIGGKEVKAIWLKRFFPLRLSKYLRTAKVT
ncbi:SDR family oxidoreductase [Pedobacter nyackensis]|uniref:Short-chain dehydrogenase n=1 Tax=Pedobacter nyackensis TaxID=475255 RepID=A0A1W2BCS4_9SPHI|nr:SDR family oxidoreductase [Pedobacter nyackensis]SMC70634.1 Short-chain dehydrogenase [Pedobacter nyackensis]